MMKKNKTKIVATLGPASCEEATIEELVLSGATMFRINTSHNTAEAHAETIKRIRNVEKKLKTFIPVLVDLQGPKIRVGNLIEPIAIEPGKELVLEYGLEQTDPNIVPVDYKGVADDVHEGEYILLDDGKIKIQVVAKEGSKVRVKVINGELLKPRKGINIPGGTKSLSAITERDVDFIKFAVDNDADYLALSFVRDKDDILLAKKYLSHFGADIPIVAKIEKPEAVKNIKSILNVVDAVMVARGDLGIELAPEKVPMVQKMIVDEAFAQRKTCIVATQMLESMIENPIPTRAEASDVANAIFDGADAIMLSGESANGDYPLEAVSTMNVIAKRVEQALEYKEIFVSKGFTHHNVTTTDVIAHATVQMAYELSAQAIITPTESGYTSKVVSKYRPKATIIAYTPNDRVARHLNLRWGVVPVEGKAWDDVDEMIATATAASVRQGIVKQGDKTIITSGMKFGEGNTSTIRVHTI